MKRIFHNGMDDINPDDDDQRNPMLEGDDAHSTAQEEISKDMFASEKTAQEEERIDAVVNIGVRRGYPQEEIIESLQREFNMGDQEAFDAYQESVDRLGRSNLASKKTAQDMGYEVGEFIEVDAPEHFRHGDRGEVIQVDPDVDLFLVEFLDGQKLEFSGADIKKISSKKTAQEEYSAGDRVELISGEEEYFISVGSGGEILEKLTGTGDISPAWYWVKFDAEEEPHSIYVEDLQKVSSKKTADEDQEQPPEPLDLKDVVEAIEDEEKGIAEYEELSDRSQDSETAQVLDEIADDERSHKEKLEQIVLPAVIPVSDVPAETQTPAPAPNEPPPVAPEEEEGIVFSGITSDLKAKIASYVSNELVPHLWDAVESVEESKPLSTDQMKDKALMATQLRSLGYAHDADYLDSLSDEDWQYFLDNFSVLTEVTEASKKTAQTKIVEGDEVKVIAERRNGEMGVVEQKTMRDLDSPLFRVRFPDGNVETFISHEIEKVSSKKTASSVSEYQVGENVEYNNEVGEVLEILGDGMFVSFPTGQSWLYSNIDNFEKTDKSFGGHLTTVDCEAQRVFIGDRVYLYDRQTPVEVIGVDDPDHATVDTDYGIVKKHSSEMCKGHPRTMEDLEEAGLFSGKKQGKKKTADGGGEGGPYVDADGKEINQGDMVKFLSSGPDYSEGEEGEVLGWDEWTEMGVKMSDGRVVSLGGYSESIIRIVGRRKYSSKKKAQHEPEFQITDNVMVQEHSGSPEYEGKVVDIVRWDEVVNEWVYMISTAEEDQEEVTESSLYKAGSKKKALMTEEEILAKVPVEVMKLVHELHDQELLEEAAKLLRDYGIDEESIQYMTVGASKKTAEFDTALRSKMTDLGYAKEDYELAPTDGGTSLTLTSALAELIHLEQLAELLRPDFNPQVDPDAKAIRFSEIEGTGGIAKKTAQYVSPFEPDFREGDHVVCQQEYGFVGGTVKSIDKIKGTAVIQPALGAEIEVSLSKLKFSKKKTAQELFYEGEIVKVIELSSPHFGQLGEIVSIGSEDAALTLEFPDGTRETFSDGQTEKLAKGITGKKKTAQGDAGAMDNIPLQEPGQESVQTGDLALYTPDDGPYAGQQMEGTIIDADDYHATIQLSGTGEEFSDMKDSFTKVGKKKTAQNPMDLNIGEDVVVNDPDRGIDGKEGVVVNIYGVEYGSPEYEVELDEGGPRIIVAPEYVTKLVASKKRSSKTAQVFTSELNEILQRDFDFTLPELSKRMKDLMQFVEEKVDQQGETVDDAVGQWVDKTDSGNLIIGEVQ